MARHMSGTSSLSLLLVVIGLLLCCRSVAASPQCSSDSDQFAIVATPEHESQLKLNYCNQAAALTEAQKLNDSIHNVDPNQPITGIIVKGHCSLVNLTALEELVKTRSEDLVELHWQINCPMPSSMLQLLEHMPSLRLYYKVPMFRSNEADRRSLLSMNLYALNCHLVYGGESNFQDLQLIYDILATHPHLRELDLTLEHSGCVWSDNPYAFDFTQNTRQLPSLERLKLSGYRLDNLKNGQGQGYKDDTDYLSWVLPPWSYLPRWATDWLWWFIDEHGGLNATAQDSDIRRSRISSHEQLQQYEPHNLDAWLEVMDWSKLQTLKLDSATPKMLQRLSPVLQSLKHFTLGSGQGMVASEIPAFFTNLTEPLHSLSLHNIMFEQFDDVVKAIVLSSNSTLSALTLTEHEETRMHYCMSYWSDEHCVHQPLGTYYSPRPFLKSDHVEQLSASAHCLTDLEIDIARIPQTNGFQERNETQWYIDLPALNTAAMIPKLTNLNINVESPDRVVSGIDDQPTWARRGVTEDMAFNRSSVPRLFQDLNEQRALAGLKPLRELVVKVGQWDSLGMDWGMLDPPPLLAGKWRCQNNESGVPQCCGGNKLMNAWRQGGGGELQDPYSPDWTLDDETALRMHSGGCDSLSGDGVWLADWD